MYAPAFFLTISPIYLNMPYYIFNYSNNVSFDCNVLIREENKMSKYNTDGLFNFVYRCLFIIPVFKDDSDALEFYRKANESNGLINTSLLLEEVDLSQCKCIWEKGFYSIHVDTSKRNILVRKPNPFSSDLIDKEPFFKYGIFLDDFDCKYIIEGRKTK